MKRAWPTSMCIQWRQPILDAKVGGGGPKDNSWLDSVHWQRHKEAWEMLLSFVLCKTDSRLSRWIVTQFLYNSGRNNCIGVPTKILGDCVPLLIPWILRPSAHHYQVSKVVVEPYNALFSASHLISNSDETFLVDNEALHSICVHTLKLTSASYQDMNLLISATMAGQSSDLQVIVRFAPSLFWSMSKVFIPSFSGIQIILIFLL